MLTKLLDALGATRSFLTFVLKEVTTPIEMMRANQRVAVMSIDTHNFEALEESDLKSFVESEWTRAKELDDKQQKLTATLSIAVTAGGLAGSTILQALNGSWAKDAAATLFLVAAALLVVGTLVAFNALKPKRRYAYGAAYRRIIAEGGPAAKRELIEAATEFERDNTIRANEATAAAASIRNGVLVLAIALLMSLIAAASGKNQPKDEEMPRAVPVRYGRETPWCSGANAPAAQCTGTSFVTVG